MARAPEDREPINDRLAAVQGLIRLFQLERYVYLGITSLSLLMLMAAVARLLLEGKNDPVLLTSMFGSSGLITYALGRVLRMFDQAVGLLSGVAPGKAL